MSVIIPVRNAAKTLGETLGGLARQDYRGQWEVIVADNGSSDRPGEVVSEWYGRLPGLRLVHADGRPGAAHARNAALAVSEGDLIACCDGDDIPYEAWLGSLVGFARHADGVGGCRDMVSLDRRWRGASRVVGTPERLPSVMEFLPFLPGNNCAIWRSALEAVGGWDEEFLTGEDVDLSWRLQLAGFTLSPVPGAVVAIRPRPTAAAHARQYFRYGLSRPQLYRKYRGSGVPPSSARTAVRIWAWLGAHAYESLRRDTQAQWIRMASLQAGHLVGSWRSGVLYL